MGLVCAGKRIDGREYEAMMLPGPSWDLSASKTLCARWGSTSTQARKHICVHHTTHHHYKPRSASAMHSTRHCPDVADKIFKQTIGGPRLAASTGPAIS
jgi:hypothetical protein